MLQPGDVFATKMPDGRYGAVCFIKTLGNSSLVYTTDYLDTGRPSLDNPLLYKALMQKRFSFDGWPARQLLDGDPPNNFEHIGNISLPNSVADLDCLSHGGIWNESIGQEVYLEWRWLHDREALEEEIRKSQEERESRRRQSQKGEKTKRKWGVRVMGKKAPKWIALEHDDYAAEYVGRTKNGRQFFLTTPFVPGLGTNPGREFIALYIFDKAGHLQSATVDDLGSRAAMDKEARVARRNEMLASLGEVRYQRIKVAPFVIEIFGVEFGFIPSPPDERGDDWSVIVEPGNYMCFWPPWTSGEYDT